MPRPPRLEFPGALYHVTARGNRASLYRDDADREEYLARLAPYRQKLGFRLLSVCLMGNHIHLAVRAGQAPMSRVMAAVAAFNGKSKQAESAPASAKPDPKVVDAEFEEVLVSALSISS